MCDNINLWVVIWVVNFPLAISAQILFERDSPTINGEEYLTLLEGTQSQAKKEFYTQIYNYLLAKRQKK